MTIRSEIAGILAAFKSNWKLFLGIHVAANLFSLLVLLPLFSTLMGWLILASGDVALTDEDILLFFLSPLGFLIFIIAAALLITVAVFEQAALFIAAYRAMEGKPIAIMRLGRYLLGRFPALFELAVRMVVRAAIIAAPFLAVAGGVFFIFLTEFDINFYLSAHPPIFWWAGGAIGLCLLAMAWILFRVFAGWIAALPLLLLEQGKPSEVLLASRDVAGHLRRPVARALAVWVVVNSLLLTIVATMLDASVWLAMRVAGESLQTMAYLMGGILVFWTLANLAVTFFGTCTLSLGVLSIFRQISPVLEDNRLDARLTHDGEGRQWKVSGALLGGVAIVATVLAGFVLKVTIDRYEVGDHAEIIAHRGASEVAPENTLAAMEEAIRQGADWLEIDVQETAEGEIVVIHDRDLKKVGGSPLRVWDSPLTELQAVDIGSWKDPKFADQRVPTLEELLERVKGRVRVNIELKYYGQEQRFEELVAEIVEDAGMQDDIVFMSLSLPGVRKMKSLRPHWQVGLLSSVAIGNVTRLDADFFAINARFANRRFIKSAHRRERGVLTWTVNDPVMMSAMMSKNVDGIITDKPGLAKQVRAERSELGLHELFMIHFAALLGGRLGSEQ